MARFAAVGEKLPLMLIFSVLVIWGNGIQAQVQSQVNPGFRFRVSEKAFQFLAELFKDLLTKEAKKNQIFDQKGMTSLTIGSVNYEVTNIQMTDFVKPTSNVVLRPGTITLALTNASISVAGDWKYKYNLWVFDVKDSGSFKGSVNNVSITLSLTLGLNDNGRPTISVRGCNRSISSVTLELNGATDLKYKLFLSKIESSIQKQLQAKLCDVATRAINVKANDLLTSFPLQKAVANDLLLDNRFLSAPEIQSGFVEAKLRGAFYYRGDTTDQLPIQADPCPATTSDKMLTMSISDFVPRTLGYAIYRKNILRYNLTHRNLPDGFKTFLNASCSEQYCLTNVFPKLSNQYPNASVEIELVATKAPSTNISSGGIVNTLSGNVTFRARLPAGSLVEILKINITLNVFVTVTFNSTGLKSNVTKIVPTVVILKSAVGSVSSDVIARFIELLGKTLLIPQLNKISGDGIPLPLPLNVKFKDVAIEMQNHCLHIVTNVERNP